MIIKIFETYGDVVARLENKVEENIAWLESFLQKNIEQRIFVQGVLKVIPQDVQMTYFSAGSDVILDVNIPYLLANKLAASADLEINYWDLFEPLLFLETVKLSFDLLHRPKFTMPLSELLDTAIQRIILAVKYGLDKKRISAKKTVQKALPDLLRSTLLDLESTELGKNTINALRDLVDNEYTIRESIALILYSTLPLSRQEDASYYKAIASDLFSMTDALEDELFTDDNQINNDKLRKLIFEPQMYVTSNQKLQQAIQQQLMELERRKKPKTDTSPFMSELKDTILKRRKTKESD